MAFQFVHVQTFSIKSGGTGIAAEAERKESHSRHVEKPEPPILLAGVEPIAAWNALVERHGKARDRYTKKSGVKAERKLRSDAHILIGAVASHPEPTATCDTDSPEFKDWLQRSIAFFTKEHGEPLSVVMHLDESHPHIHFLTAPDLENGQRMPDIHAGEKAREAAGGKHAKKHVKDQAWKEAMRGYQDRYQEAVGVYHGLARLGPKRRRLPAGAYQAEQAEAKRQAEQLRALESQAETITTQKTDLDQRERSAAEAQAKIIVATGELENRERDVLVAQVEVAELKERLGNAQGEVRKAEKKLNKRNEKLKTTKEQLDQRVARVSQREQRLAGVWGAVVSVFTLGLAGTKQRVQKAVKGVKADFAAELAETTAAAGRAAKAHEKAVQRLESQNRLLTEQNMTLNGAVSTAERAQREAISRTQELVDKLGPVEAENSELKAVRDNLEALADDVQAALSAGDVALAQDLLNPDSAGPELRV